MPNIQDALTKGVIFGLLLTLVLMFVVPYLATMFPDWIVDISGAGTFLTMLVTLALGNFLIFLAAEYNATVRKWLAK